jgi:hypothetical protein
MKFELHRVDVAETHRRLLKYNEKSKVKVSHYRPRQAQRVPGS